MSQRILSISMDHVPCEFAGRLAVDAGLEVIKIEPAGGDPLRETRGALADWLLAGKRSITWGPQGIGDDVLEFLTTASAAVLVDEWGRDWLLARLGKRLPQSLIVLVGERDSESLAGCPADRSDEFLAFHGAGLGFLTPRVMPGYPSADPLCPRANLLEFMTGLYGAIGLFALLAAPGHDARAAHVGLSGAALPLLRRELAAVLLEGAKPHRSERIWKVSPAEVHRCSDGWIFVDVIEDAQWLRLCAWMGQPELAVEPWCSTREERFAHADRLCVLLDAFFADKPQSCWLDAQQQGVPVAPVNDIAALLADRHLQGRGFWGPLVTSHGSTVRAPITPMARVFGKPASDLRVPRPGQDTQRMVAEHGAVAS